MVYKNFIRLTATSNVFTVHCKTHKVLLVRVSSKGTHLREEMREGEIKCAFVYIYIYKKHKSTDRFPKSFD